MTIPTPALRFKFEGQWTFEIWCPFWNCLLVVQSELDSVQDSHRWMQL